LCLQSSLKVLKRFEREAGANIKHVLFMGSTALILLGCNSQSEIKSQQWKIGASAVAQCTFGQPSATGKLSTNPVTIQKSGSMLLVSLARGYWASPPQTPTDNQTNTFALQDSSHNYIDYPGSATALYHAIDATGGFNHVFSMPWSNSDELTLSAIEVTGATTIEDSSWVERAASNTISSVNVHTNGPAILVAWWWGSGSVRPVGDTHKAVPGNGFTLIPNATGLVSLSTDGYIQVAAAYRIVNTAGNYNVTWQTDNEGAQLYLVALR
jgi:hypothetical protein